MGERKVEVGHRFRKTDGTGLVFQVGDLLHRAGLPHALMVSVTNPFDQRVIAVSVLHDKRHFEPARGAAADAPPMAPMRATG